MTATLTGFRGVSVPTGMRSVGDVVTWLKDAATVINQLLLGRLNVTGTVTLNAGATTTTVSDPRVGNDSHISLSPLTAHAAAVIATCYISARTAKTSFVVTHSNTADVDKTFTYAILG